MDNPTILSATSSPEFEFCMVGNSSFPETTLHSADELFSGGVILPLRLLNIQHSDDPPDKTAAVDSPAALSPEPGSGSDLTNTLTASKRWIDIFKRNPESKEKEKKKKERNSGAGAGAGAGMSMTELNINLWPFSRSRSAGNGGSRPRTTAPVKRKTSSAPCSRSNSAGESKSRKWPNSPNRGGVHLGRSSPVWQVKRSGSGRSFHDNLVRSTAEKSVHKKEGSDTRRSKKSTNSGEATGAGAKAKVLTLNVPTCIGYRPHLSCRSNEIQDPKTIRNAGVIADGEGARGSNLFNLRNLFTKKVY